MLWKPSITPSDVIKHSAKGSEWEEHKYVKKEGDKYFYSESYEGGRHVGGPADKETKDSSSSKAQKYSEGDSDFDEKNYSPKNLLGDTNFYGYVNKNGQTVILEEDQKWVLPKGKKLDKALIKRLEAFDKEVERRRDAGETIGAEEWEKLASQAINGSGAKKSKTSKKSSASKGSKGSSKSKEMSDKERRAKNKQTIKSRTEEQQKNKEERMKKNRMNGKAYLNHSFWAPTDNYLVHHGIPNQKWGVRNGPPYPLDEGQKSPAEKRYRTDKGYKKRSHKKNRPASQMSNNELRRQIERKQLEQRYNELTDDQVNRGRQKVMSLIRDYGTAAGAIATTAAIVKTAYQIKNGRFGK